MAQTDEGKDQAQKNAPEGQTKSRRTAGARRPKGRARGIKKERGTRKRIAPKPIRESISPPADPYEERPAEEEQREPMPPPLSAEEPGEKREEDEEPSQEEA